MMEQLFGNINQMPSRILILLLVVLPLVGLGQTFEVTEEGDTINYTDRKGLSQGFWIIRFPFRWERTPVLSIKPILP